MKMSLQVRITESSSQIRRTTTKEAPVCQLQRFPIPNIKIWIDIHTKYILKQNDRPSLLQISSLSSLVKISPRKSFSVVSEMITTSLAANQQEPEDVVDNFLDMFRDSVRERDDMLLEPFTIFGVSFEAGKICGMANVDRWSNVDADTRFNQFLKSQHQC